jgi:hypothetical protein
MAIATPISPALLAEEIRAKARELSQVIPQLPPEVQPLALSALALERERLLDPKVIAQFSAGDLPKAPDGLSAYAVWVRWAETYLEVLQRLLQLAEAPGPAAAAS